MKSLVLLIAFASSCLALTPKERELVQGLTSINMALRQQIEADEAAISQKDTDYLFLKQKNESLTLRHDALVKLAGDQEWELNQQQQKAKDQEQALFREGLRADSAEAIAKKKTLEAHRSATERDIGVFITSVFATVLVMIYSGQIIGWITSKFPALTAYGIGLWIGLAVLTFLSSFGAIRGVLAMISSRL
jgi:hypothetical protein